MSEQPKRPTRLMKPPRGRYSVEVDGVPLTRERMVAELVEAYIERLGTDAEHARAYVEYRLLRPGPMFDEARGLYKEFAVKIRDWLREHGVDAELGRAR